MELLDERAARLARFTSEHLGELCRREHGMGRFALRTPQGNGGHIRGIGLDEHTVDGDHRRRFARGHAAAHPEIRLLAIEQEEARIARIAPDRIISTIIELQRQWGCLVWGVEAVQFQEFFRTELLRRSAQAGVPVPARALVPITDKALRIESLQPHMAAGLIRVHSSQATLVEQLRHWPHAAHDDGPDALHMLWMLAASSGMAAGSQSSGGQQSARQRYARQAQRMFRPLRGGGGWRI